MAGLGKLWHKYKGWLAILIFMCVFIGYTIEYLLFNPQHVPFFFTIIIIALSFITIMTLLSPQYMQRLVEGILAYHAKGKERGWLYRYQKIAFILIFACTFSIIIVSQHQLIPMQYMPLFVIASLTIILTSGAVLIAGLIKFAGKWGLLLIAIVAAIVILRHIILS
jgi:hypothetical protein